MSIEEIIHDLSSLAQRKRAENAIVPDGFPVDSQLVQEERLLREAIAMLRTHQESQPNEPLTLAELREMVGEPVWVRCISEPLLNGWQIVAGVDTEDCGTLYCEGEETFRYYGRAWLAYRRLPKED